MTRHFALAMPRRQIALPGTDGRLFNARGRVSFRGRNVTRIEKWGVAPGSLTLIPDRP